MKSRVLLYVAVAFLIGFCARGTSVAQTVIAPNSQTRDSFVPSRVVERVDETKATRLSGNTHLMARPEFDQGLVDPQLAMERLQLVLKRSAEQETALDQFMAQQYDPKSANFHHWLSPDEFGRLYGPSDSDIAAVTSWLGNHGFRIDSVSKGRVTIEFSGTASQVHQAFQVEMHRYLVNAAMHVANERDPQIPEALSPVIAGIASLHDFFPAHQSVLGRFVKRDAKTGKVTPVESISRPSPQYGFPDPNAGSVENEDITP